MDRRVGAAVLTGDAIVRRHIPVRAVAAAADPFLLFVLALSVIVVGVLGNGLDPLVGHLAPAGSSVPELLAVAGLAAVLANLVNNLPATLALIPIVAPAGAGPCWPC